MVSTPHDPEIPGALTVARRVNGGRIADSAGILSLRSRAGLQRGLRPRRGSVLVVVMITLLFATFALLAFMEKASVDLLVDQREAVSRRLRMEAYSALETTLAVLENFREASNGLRSPAEGWSDPLGFAGYLPSEGRTVEVTFEDESGKLPLPRLNAEVLVRLFENWGVLKAEAETLADALLGWMKRNHVYTSAVLPDYDSAALPFEAPGRSLRSYHELAAIEKAREFFYDTDGRPNDNWTRFAAAVSLLDFQKPNLNGAKPDTLAALGQFDEQQRQNLGDYLSGAGTYQTAGPGYFQAPNEAGRIAGPAGDTGAFSATISALRINVTVRDGRSEYRVAVVVAPPEGATTVKENASTSRRETAAGAAKTAQQQQRRPDATKAAAPAAARNGGAAAKSLRYPFTLLEIRENDEIPPPPPPSAEPPI